MAKKSGGEQEITYCKVINIEPALMDAHEAAAYLRISYTMFRKYVKADILPVMVTQKCVRYLKADLDGWIREHRKTN